MASGFLSFKEIDEIASRDARIFSIAQKHKRIEAAEALADAVDLARSRGGLSLDGVFKTLGPVDADFLRQSFPDMIKELVSRIEAGKDVSMRDLVDGARAALHSFESGKLGRVMTDGERVAVELARMGRIDRLHDLGPRLLRIEKARSRGIGALLLVFIVEKTRSFSRTLLLWRRSRCRVHGDRRQD